MRTDNPAENGVSGQGILLQREEIMVAVVLDARCNQEKRDADKGAERRSYRNLDVVENHFMRQQGS